MQTNGVLLALLDIPATHTEEYNRWYDLDHMPEHVAKPDVLMGRRYVATRDLRAAAGVLRSDRLGGHPPYLTTYWFGGPVDFTSDEAAAGWRATDRVIVKSGRYWNVGHGTHTSRWRLAGAHARPSVLVDGVAIPYLAHRGVIVAVGTAPSPERVDDAAAWWDRVHLPDLFAVPGVLAAVRFVPADPGPEATLFHLIMCDDPVGDVMSRIHHAGRFWRAVGRYPAHGGVYEPEAFLPYQWIIPLQYDFEVGDPETSSAGTPA